MTDDKAPAATPDPVLTKLLKAAEMAKPVAKEGRNKEQNYDYARAEDVIREARRVLHECGLVAVIDYVVSEQREVRAKSGTAGAFVSVNATLRILDPDAGRAIEIRGVGAGIDYPGDKAPYKAMTGAAKYVYASALGIPFGDDPEDDSRGSTSAQAQADTQPRGFRDLLQADWFRAAVEMAGGGPYVGAIVDAANERLTPKQIDNADQWLRKNATRAETMRKLRKLAGVPVDPAEPDTRDLPTLEDAMRDDAGSVAESVQGEVVEQTAGYFDPATDESL